MKRIKDFKFNKEFIKKNFKNKEIKLHKEELDEKELKDEPKEIVDRVEKSKTEGKEESKVIEEPKEANNNENDTSTKTCDSNKDSNDNENSQESIDDKINNKDALIDVEKEDIKDDEFYKIKKHEIESNKLMLLDYLIEVEDPSEKYKVNKYLLIPFEKDNLANFAFANGYKTFISVYKNPSGKGANFRILVNPLEDNPVLDDNLIEFGEYYQALYGSSIHISNCKGKILCENDNESLDNKIYEDLDSKDAVKVLVSEIKNIIEGKDTLDIKTSLKSKNNDNEDDEDDTDDEDDEDEIKDKYNLISNEYINAIKDGKGEI